MSALPLYGDPEMYSRIFPADGGEARFFAALLREAVPGLTVLDAACGTAPLAGSLPLPTAGLDLSAELLRWAPARARVVRGDLGALPFRTASLGGVFSRLFGYGYAIGAAPDRASDLARELGRVLREGAPVALELPLAWRPARLQGIEETACLPGGLRYRFRYLDLLEKTPFGAVLASRIEASLPGQGEWLLAAPLHVHTPEGARRWLAAAGAAEVAFWAPYDLSTRTATPPEDCLRAVVTGRRGGQNPTPRPGGAKGRRSP